jgi:hypothetical protein
MLCLTDNLIYSLTDNENDRAFIKVIHLSYLMYPNEINKLYNLYIDICWDYQLDLYKDKLLTINKILLNILTLNGPANLRLMSSLLYKRAKYNIDNKMIKNLIYIVREINSKIPNNDISIKYFMDVTLNVYANVSINKKI